MDKQKKDTEKRTLIRFVSNKSLRLRIAGITAMDPPDFKMSRYVNKIFKEIGVEITRVLNPQLKKFESAQHRIVELALLEFKKTHSDNLVVYVDFSNAPFSLEPDSLQNLSISLSKMVKGIVENNRGYLFRVDTNHALRDSIFENITVSNEEFDFENWQPVGVLQSTI